MVKWNGGYTWDTPPSRTGAPPRLKVATCQIPLTHDTELNTNRIADLVMQAAAAGADVAHFPECAISGYGPADWPLWDNFGWEELEVAVKEVQAVAKRSGIWIVAGSVHRTTVDARPTNSLLVFDRQGELADRYEKRRCSVNDLRAFAPGQKQLILDIEGLKCGFLICPDWSFPELWQAYAGEVELVFHSCASDDTQRNRIEAHTIQPLLQGYAWLHQFAVSSSNSCRPRQNFASFWVERSGHLGATMERDRTGIVLNALADDPDQDRFFAMVQAFRASASDGSLYAPHITAPV